MALHNRYRRVRAVMYALLVVAGVCAVIFPSKLVQDQVGGVVVFVWSACIVVSAGGAFYGAATDKWIGEYSGLPLLSISLGLYSISAILGAGLNPSPLFAYGLVVAAFSVGLYARWLDVRDEKRRAESQGLVEETEG